MCKGSLFQYLVPGGSIRPCVRLGEDDQRILYKIQEKLKLRADSLMTRTGKNEACPETVFGQRTVMRISSRVVYC